MELIAYRHFANWVATRKRDCEQTLPLLVQKLILATTTRVDVLSFPHGDAVALGGWDGRLHCASSHRFVPDGASGWEIGTETPILEKADGDYRKRSADPLDLVAVSSTFVFVTPRVWPRRTLWARDRAADGTWQDVRVIAAEELADWLADAPAVALWLAAHLGLTPRHGLASLEGWWADYQSATDPALPATALTGGRSREATMLRDWASGARQVAEVEGETPEEGIAFLFAAAAAWPEPERDALLARCVVATTSDALRSLAVWNRRMVIVAPAELADDAKSATVANGHKLLLAGGRSAFERDRQVIRLPRVDGEALLDALIAARLERAEAKRIIWETGGSIAVLRRRRSRFVPISKPPWASAERGAELLPALLAGAWSEAERPAEDPFGVQQTPLRDRDVLAALSGGDYGAFRTLAKWAADGDDPLLRRAGDVWKLLSVPDAWGALARHIEATHLKRLGDIAYEVFATPNPRYELPPEQRFAAPIYGKVPPHSGWLREGLATTLAVVANLGDRLGLPAPDGEAAGFVARLVRRILAHCQDWQAWASLNDVLPLLTEAAPDAVLDAIETTLRDNQQVFVDLLSDDGAQFGSECRHSGLLWALERAAWHPRYLNRVCVALARLDALDPKGNWANRPFASLVDILLWPQDPYTFADVSARLSAIDVIRAQVSETWWRLIKVAIRDHHFRIVREPPYFLDAKPPGWAAPTMAECQRFGTGLTARLDAALSAAPDSELIELMRRMDSLPTAQQEALVAVLERQAVGRPVRQLLPIRDAVRRHLHEAQSDSSRRQPTEPGLVTRLADLYARLEPEDVFERVAWLFEDWNPHLPEGRRGNLSAYRRLVAQRQAEAIRAVLDQSGLSKLIDWAGNLPRAADAGVALAEIATDEEDATLAPLLVSTALSDLRMPPVLLMAYARKRISLHGEAWLEKWLKVADRVIDPAAAKAALLRVLPEGRDTWVRVAAYGEEVEHQYWLWTLGWFHPDLAPADRAFAVEKLHRHGQPFAALNALADDAESLAPGHLLLAIGRQVLAHLATSTDNRPVDGFLDGYERLLELLDLAPEIARDEVVQLEWPFFEVLRHRKRGPRALRQLIAAEPSNFVQLLIWVFKRDDGTTDDLRGDENLTVEQLRRRGEIAYELLHEWRGPLPGAVDGQLQPDALLKWIAEVRRLASDVGRSRSAERKIGVMLAASPPGDAGAIWPHPAVQAALEANPTEAVGDGFVMGVHNRRGMTSRDPRDGGQQERDLADCYAGYASRAEIEAPFTASLLRRLAEGYRHDAKRHDQDAALHRLCWG